MLSLPCRHNSHFVCIFCAFVMATEFEIDLGSGGAVDAAAFAEAVAKASTLLSANDGGSNVSARGSAVADGSAFGMSDDEQDVNLGVAGTPGRSGKDAAVAERFERWLQKKNKKLEIARKAAEEAKLNDPDLCFSPRLVSVRGMFERSESQLRRPQAARPPRGSLAGHATSAQTTHPLAHALTHPFPPYIIPYPSAETAVQRDAAEGRCIAPSGMDSAA